MGMHKTEESLRVAMRGNASIYKEEIMNNYEGFDPNDPDTYIALAFDRTYSRQEFGTREHDSIPISRSRRAKRQRCPSGRYYVISFTTMPACWWSLILTNPDEEDFLNSENGKIIWLLLCSI